MFNIYLLRASKRVLTCWVGGWVVKNGNLMPILSWHKGCQRVKSTDSNLNQFTETVFPFIFENVVKFHKLSKHTWKKSLYHISGCEPWDSRLLCRNIGRNKLGLSCAELRASFALLGLNWLIWFGFANFIETLEFLDFEGFVWKVWFSRFG